MPALGDEALRAVGRLAVAVRDAVGERDIEFALVEGEARLLQARPITSLDAADAEEASAFEFEWEDPSDAAYSWRLSSQRATPMLQRDLRERYERHLAQVFADTGVAMGRSHIGIWVNGFRYTRGPEVDEVDVAKRLSAHQQRNQDLLASGGSIWRGQHGELLPKGQVLEHQVVL